MLINTEHKGVILGQIMQILKPSAKELSLPPETHLLVSTLDETLIPYLEAVLLGGEIGLFILIFPQYSFNNYLAVTL